VHRLFDGTLQLVVIVDVLDNIIYSILEALYVCVVVADLIAVCFDDVLHLGLTVTKVIDHLTEMGVCSVITLKGSVHLISLLLKLADLLLLRLYLSLELFNLVVENEFEFLQFLSLFLEAINLVFFFPDCVVFLDDLKRLFTDVLS
jgi:hypothetical protein